MNDRISGQGGKTGDKRDGESRQQNSSVPHTNLLVWTMFVPTARPTTFKGARWLLK
jgi:hypothetical protein